MQSEGLELPRLTEQIQVLHKQKNETTRNHRKEQVVHTTEEYSLNTRERQKQNK